MQNSQADLFFYRRNAAMEEKSASHHLLVEKCGFSGRKSPGSAAVLRN